jgi:DNA-binding IscR family transcriptional regulator
MPEAVTVGEIISLMEGPIGKRGTPGTRADKVAIYRVFDEVHHAIANILNRSTLQELYATTRELSERRRVSEMYYI